MLKENFVELNKYKEVKSFMSDKIWNNKCIISPSLITLDMCNLEAQCRILEEAGINLLHIDILDGYFSPSMPLGIDTVKQLKKKTCLEFEAHVMAVNPQFFVDELIEAGVSQIVFHIETCEHVDGMLNYIHSKGIRAGVALKPATSLNQLEYILEKCDSVLLMLINPGYAQMKGESQVIYSRRKITDLHAMIKNRDLDTKVILDGRVSAENIMEYGSKDMANIFVAGSTCVRKQSLLEDLKKIKMIENQINKGEV